MNKLQSFDSYLLPFTIISAAKDGNSFAIKSILRYYEGYIKSLSIKTTLYDNNGTPYHGLDIYLKKG